MIDAVGFASLLLWIAAPVAIYGIVRVVALVVTQPYRMQLAREGEERLARDDISDDERQNLKRLMDHALDWRFVVAASWLLPLLMGLMATVVMLGWSPKPASNHSSEDPGEVEQNIFVLVVISMAGMAPFAVLLFVVQCLLFVAPIAWMARLINGASAKVLSLRKLVEGAARAMHWA